jgi:hypothetical protein
MLTRLLDRWYAHQIARTRRGLPIDTSISVAGYPDCVCGHVADVHRHYRDGFDCSQCDCRSYTRRTP